MKKPSQRIMWLTLVALLAGVGLWSQLRAANTKVHAQRSAAAWAECRELAASITELKKAPSVAGSNEMQLTELARRIESSAADHGIPGDQIAWIRPRQAQRVTDTVYKEKPTEIRVRKVTLQQGVGFLHQLTSDDSGLRVKNLRLVAPRDAPDEESWILDATVSYLLYAPRTPSGTAHQ